jgi:hypothetical protein
MSFYLTATFDAPAVTTRLPNPTFGDWDSPTHEVIIAKSMNDTLRTFVKSKDGRRKINFGFNLTRAKAIELLEFYRAHIDDFIRIDDHLDRTWKAKFAVNPIDLESTKSLTDGPLQSTGDSMGQVTLEFEGFLQ